MAEFSPKLKEALSLVQKPGRYTGGEPGCTYKDKANVDVRMAFCFPDTYEIGMSFLGEKILYELLNRHENWWCERAFMPWVDMKEQMERLHIPLYCLESKDPLTDFDIVGFSLEYELSFVSIRYPESQLKFPYCNVSASLKICSQISQSSGWTSL